MRMDKKGWAELVKTLKSQGWTGTTTQLQALIAQISAEAKLRLMFAAWTWSNGARQMVAALVDCTEKRGGSVMVTSDGNWGDTDAGPHILLSFPKGSRLQAMQLQVKHNRVYVVRKFRGDWRSARNFYPKNVAVEAK
jgi:hypothetical protein